MKRLFFVAILVILVAGLVLLGLNDTIISTADTGIPDNEATSIMSKTNNSSASASITITMTGVLNE